MNCDDTSSSGGGGGGSGDSVGVAGRRTGEREKPLNSVQLGVSNKRQKPKEPLE